MDDDVFDFYDLSDDNKTDNIIKKYTIVSDNQNIKYNTTIDRKTIDGLQ